MARADGGGRLFVVDRRRGGQFLAEDEAWKPAVGAKTMVARQGQSCESRCGQEGMRCAERELEFVNSCADLAAHFPCEAGCGHQIGEEIPCYVSDPAAPTYQQCLVTEQRMPRCKAAHRSTTRLCSCV